MIKNHILYNDFSDWRFDISRAEGSFIWDHKGKKLIDFTSGWNVANLGWNNPELSKALIAQSKKNAYAPMWTADPIQNEYAAAFTKALPKELSVIARATGGTEANEEAIKTARAFTGRKKILGFKNTYHGQSFGTMAIGWLPEYPVTRAIAPMPDGFVQMDFPKVYGDSQDEASLLEEFAAKLENNIGSRRYCRVCQRGGHNHGLGFNVCRAQRIFGFGETTYQKIRNALDS